MRGRTGHESGGLLVGRVGIVVRGENFGCEGGREVV